MTRMGITEASSSMMSKRSDPIEWVEATGAEVADLVLERRHPSGREDPRHEAAVHGVHGRVLEQDDARRQLDVGFDDVEDVATGVREHLPVDQPLLDILVTRECPEVVAVVVVGRRFVTEARVRRDTGRR